MTLRSGFGKFGVVPGGGGAKMYEILMWGGGGGGTAFGSNGTFGKHPAGGAGAAYAQFIVAAGTNMHLYVAQGGGYADGNAGGPNPSSSDTGFGWGRGGNGGDGFMPTGHTGAPNNSGGSSGGGGSSALIIGGVELLVAGGGGGSTGAGYSGGGHGGGANAGDGDSYPGNTGTTWPAPGPRGGLAGGSPNKNGGNGHDMGHGGYPSQGGGGGGGGSAQPGRFGGGGGAPPGPTGAGGGGGRGYASPTLISSILYDGITPADNTILRNMGIAGNADHPVRTQSPTSPPGPAPQMVPSGDGHGECRGGSNGGHGAIYLSFNGSAWVRWGSSGGYQPHIAGSLPFDAG
jgi:hypothetical protein